LQYETHFQLTEGIAIGLKGLAGFSEIAKFSATDRFQHGVSERKCLEFMLRKNRAGLADPELMFVDT
jgi:hypothetical protein